MASTFGKSFAREIGKDLGKVGMNLVFGDSWATPYRRVDPSLKKYREDKVRLEEERLSIQRQQARERAEIETRNQRYLLDSAVRENIDKLMDIPIPQDAWSLNQLLSNLSVQMKTEKYQPEIGGDESEGKIRNNYFYALIEKFEQALLELQSISPNDSHIPRYAKILVDKKNEVKKKKNLKILGIVAGVAVVLLIVGGCLLSAYNESIHPKVIDTGVVGEALETLFGKVEQPAPEPMSKSTVYVAYALFALSGLSIILIPILMLRSRLKWKKNELAYFTPVKDEMQPTQSINKTIQSIESNEVHEEVAESIFFDLNENNRIGNALNQIWRKYNGIVDNNILSRRPIFAADGVADSILFVGVNPSYDPDDDKRFLENDDKKTLLYGSFYGREDSPMYFKRLEMFAAELGKPYSQINLLYARENDRKKLLKTNPDFIREQLELTYDTIVKINPKAVVFFTDFCKNLIFGPRRWTDQSSFNPRSGSFILNGTNIPIFFSEDVTTLDADSVDSLIYRMKELNL